MRFAVINRAANQMIFSILQRNDVTIDGISERLQDLTGEYPIVPMQDSRARFYDEASHDGRVNGDW